MPEAQMPFFTRFQSLEALEVELHELTERLQKVSSHNVDFPIPMLQRAAGAHRRLAAEVAVLRQLKNCIEQSADAEALTLALAEAQHVLGAAEVPLMARCRKRLQDLQLQKPLCEAMTAVLNSRDVVQARQLVEMLQQAGLDPLSSQWLPELAGGQLQTELCALVEAEELRLQRLAQQRQAALARRAAAQQRRLGAAAAALTRRLAAAEAARQAQQAQREALEAQQLVLAEEVAELAESLVLCDMQLEELHEVQSRCSTLAEQAKSQAIGGELSRVAQELQSPGPDLMALASRLRDARDASLSSREPGGELALDGSGGLLEPGSQLLSQVQQLQAALEQERLMSSSLKAELEEIKALKGTGLLIS
ncbi:unnamed protein product [Cladocopium goreaui]|uniref:ABC transmembrane type-1 domain-containing protein n=1 Tax=Cladocopium goreaui TaxID=2562237 RepID=A0A9P1GTN5_9DINO|nr:unnamed protein product [Cladocopium goreaui]